MPEIELDLGAQLIASIETLNTALSRQEQQRQRAAQCIRQIPLVSPQMNLSAGGAGVIDIPDLLAAKTGYYWGVRRLTLSGFTAGTAVVYLNGTSGEPVAPYAEAATFTFGRGEVLMHPGDRLVVVASGVINSGDYVQLNGAADCFEQWYLPNYIG
jgi:hypothetical protein